MNKQVTSQELQDTFTAMFGEPLKKHEVEALEEIRAIEKDMENPSDSPIFWTLIIHSHPKNKIW